tara:strand:+ start:486 stop:1157 length:672 start_codon:yes stop_codon:yes gene_type:complete
MKDFTLLIQGKIKKNTKHYIEQYLNQCDKIVVSCWEDDNTTDIESIQNVTVVKNRLPDLGLVKKWQFDQSANYYYQIFSTWVGLENVDTKYTIKLRSDEYYDLSLIYQTLKLNKHSIISSNIMTTPPTVSDHIFASETEILLKCFRKLAVELNSVHKPVGILLDSPNKRVSIENTFTHLFNKMTNIIFVDYTNLGDYIIVANNLNLRFTKGQKIPIHFAGVIQ